MESAIFTDGTRNLTPPQPKFEHQYCRICLSSDDTKFKQLFSSFSTTKSIVEVIEDFAKVSISQEDEFSRLICLNCFIRLTQTNNFKELIVNSDFKLKHQQRSLKTDLIDGNNDINDEDSEHEKIIVDEIDIKKELEISDTELVDDEADYVKLVEPNGLIEDNDLKKSIETENESEGNDSEEFEDDTLSAEYFELEEDAESKEITIRKGSNRTENTERKDPLKVITGKKMCIKKLCFYKCPECGKLFKRIIECENHRIIHTGIYPFHCSFCNKGFGRKGVLKVHELTHSEEANYQCELCGKKFKQQHSLSLHKKTHEGIKPYKCDQCPREFAARNALRMHKATYHSSNPDETNLTCEICSKQYKTKYHLGNHMRDYHKPRELVKCNVCGKTVKYYKIHMKLHLSPYKCTVCDRHFGTKQGLKVHADAHTEEKLYQCDICKKMFRFKQSLLTHKKTHDSKNRFKCEFCDKVFNYRSAWKVHLKKIHKKTI